MNNFFFNQKVCDLKTWELYIGFVLLQILIGLVVTLLVGVFDLAGIRGALSQLVRQFAVVMNARSPGSYAEPILGEIRAGKYL